MKRWWIVPVLLALPAVLEASWIHSPVNIQIEEVHARLEITETVARKKVRYVFRNPTPQRTEGTFYMDLEPEAVVDGFKVRMGGQELEGELLDADKARRIYEQIVRQEKDPALLEHFGNRLLRVRIFPIPPESTFEVEVELTETLKVSDGLVRVSTLSVNPRAVAKPLKKAVFSAELSSATPIRMVYSPTHDLDIVRGSDRKVRLAYEGNEYLPATDLVFYYSLSSDEFGSTLLTHAEPGEDPVFMLSLNPRWEVDPADKLPRDIVYAVDVSGSMAHDGKMEQVRAALKECLARLSPGDRFNLVTYSTTASLFRDKLQEAEAREAAIKAVEALRPRGGTAISDALDLCLGQFDDAAGRVRLVVFLTDGIPTIGELETDGIAKKVAAGNGRNARIFSFGVGTDVNSQLLDRISLEQGGDTDYMLPGEDVGLVLGRFAEKIDAPVLASPQLRIDGAEAYDVYPRTLPDVFRGGQLVVTGRYKGDGGVPQFSLTGEANGRTRRHVFKPVPNVGHDFVPKLWAVKKVSFLLDQIRLNGAQKELVDEVVELAKRYAIVTPYTSYLITEDRPMEIETGAARDRVMRELDRSEKSGFSGGEEWAKSKEVAKLRKDEYKPAAAPAPEPAADAARNEHSLAKAQEALMRKVRQIEGRAFYGQDNEWVDSRFDSKREYSKVTEVEFGSEAYFELLRSRPRLRKVFSVGTRLTAVDGDEVLRVK